MSTRLVPALLLVVLITLLWRSGGGHFFCRTPLGVVAVLAEPW